MGQFTGIRWATLLALEVRTDYNILTTVLNTNYCNDVLLVSILNPSSKIKKFDSPDDRFEIDCFSDDDVIGIVMFDKKVIFEF